MGLLTFRRALLSGGSRIPNWVLQPNGAVASVDLDFVNNRQWTSTGGQAPLATSGLLSCVRASGGYAQTAEGTLQWFVANQLRVTDLGMLIEMGSTNVLRYSTTFNPSAWTADNLAGGGAVPLAVIAPDGSPSAYVAIPLASAGTDHRLYDPTDTIVGTVASYSLYVKPAGYTQIALRENNSTGASAIFNLTGQGSVTGIYAAGALTVFPSITALANGWFRITMTLTFSSSTTQSFGLIVMNGGWTSGDPISYSFTPDGSSGIAIWGPQFEASGTPTSYFPTTTASGTRSADVITLPFTSIPSWSLNKGSIRCEASTPQMLAYNIAGQALAGTDVVHVELFLSLTNPGATTVACGVLIDASGSGSSANVYTPSGSGDGSIVGGVQAGMTWNSTGSPQFLAGAINGGTVGTDATHALSWTGATQWCLGARFNGGSGSNFLNGYLTRFTAWGSVTLSNTTLQTVTNLPSWLLSIGGQTPTIDIDFLNDRAWVNGAPATIPALLTDGRTSSGYAQNAEGVLNFFTGNALRYNDNGLLVENATTNLLLQSNTFGTTWIATALTNLTTTTNGPDGGSTNGTLLNETIANSTHQVSQNPGKAASAIPYAFSVYAKAGPGRTRVYLQCDDGGANTAECTYDLAGSQIGVPAAITGTFTSPSATITPLANGWYRCTLAFTSNTATILNCTIRNDSGSGTGAAANSYVGVVNDGVYIWGAQLEQVAANTTPPTSYVPTTTSSATRINDTITMNFVLPTTYTAYTKTLGANPAGVRIIGGDINSASVLGTDFGSTVDQFDGLGHDLAATIGYGTIAGSLQTAVTGNPSGRSVVGNSGQVSSDAHPPTANSTVLNFGFGAGTVLAGYLQRFSLFTGPAVAATPLQQATGIPNWVLAPGGNVPQLDLDFVGNRGWAAPGTSSNPNQSLAALLSVTNSGGYYQTAAGTLISFGANTLRVGDQGLLVEESRTNLITHSQTFTDPSWSEVGSTVTAAATTAPDGTLTATAVSEDASNGVHNLIQQSGDSATGPYTFSCYVKPINRTWVTGSFSGNPGNSGAYFNLVGAGSVGVRETNNTSASIQALANGWYFIQITATNVSGLVQAGIYLASANGVNSFQGLSQQSVYIWGAQLEQASFATSYIATAGATVTRNADAVQLTPIPWFSQTAGTLMATMMLPNPSAGSQWGPRFDNAGFSAHALSIVNAGGTLEAAAGGVNAFPGNAPANVPFTVAMSATAGGNDSASLNGGAPASTPGVSSPFAVGTDRMWIGVTGAFTNGYVQRVTYWNTAFSPQ